MPRDIQPREQSISKTIKNFNIIKGRGSPIWITLFPYVFAHSICPDHLKTHRITLGSRTDHGWDHASDQVLCFLSQATADHTIVFLAPCSMSTADHASDQVLWFLSKATADHIPGSLLYANCVNGENLATLMEEILCEGIPYDSLCCPQSFASEALWSRLW